MNATTARGFARREHLVALAIFVGVLILLFYRGFFFGEVLAPLDRLTKDPPWRGLLRQDAGVQNIRDEDTLVLFYPWKHFIHDELRAGRFPLWCTYVSCGYPLDGQGIIKLFGLTTFFLWLAAPATASLLSYSAQLLIAMAGMYVLLRTLHFRWLPAILGGLIFGLNSAMLQRLTEEHITGALMLLPWIGWALWHAGTADRHPSRFAGLGGLFFGLTILNGSLQSAMIVWISATAFMVTAMWQRPWPGSLRRAVLTTLTFSVLGILVAAVAMLPNLELMAHNTRERFEHLNWFELMTKRPVRLLPWLAALVNPDSIGNYRTFDLVGVLGHVGSSATTPGMTDLRTYCGLAGVVLAVFGLRSRHEAKALGVVLVITPLVVAFVSPLYPVLYFRSLSPVVCGIALLAALGLDRFAADDNKLEGFIRGTSVTILALIGVTLLAGATVSVQRDRLLQTIEKRGAAQAAFRLEDRAWWEEKARQTVDNFTIRGFAVARFCVFAVALLAVLRIKVHTLRPSLVAGALVVLNTADLVEFAWRTLPSVPSSLDYPLTPALEFLQKQPGKFRIMSAWKLTEPRTLRPNLLLPYHLDDPRILESLRPQNPFLASLDWDELNVRFLVVPPGSGAVTDGMGPVMLSDHDLVPSFPPSPRPRIWHLVYRGEVDIYENPDMQPRVCFAAQPNSALAEPATITITSYVSGNIQTDVEASTNGWLVVRERNYPGWRATVDGNTAPVVTAKGMWQAVALSPGRHKITLRYQPMSVRWGAALTLAGLLAVGAWWMAGPGET